MQVKRAGTNLEVGCTQKNEWGRKETYLASVRTWSARHDLEQMGNLSKQPGLQRQQNVTSKNDLVHTYF